MTLGDKIRIARSMRRLTQKALGELVGLSDTRIRHYELGIRVPKEDQLQKIADALGMPMCYFQAYDIDASDNVMQLLFELEDAKGIEIAQKGGKFTISFDDISLNERIGKWAEKKAEFQAGKITREEYNLWRARFPLSSAEEDENKIKAARDSMQE